MVLEKLKAPRKYRDKIVREIVETEEFYVNSLETLVNVSIVILIIKLGQIQISSFELFSILIFR